MNVVRIAVAASVLMGGLNTAFAISADQEVADTNVLLVKDGEAAEVVAEAQPDAIVIMIEAPKPPVLKRITPVETKAEKLAQKAASVPALDNKSQKQMDSLSPEKMAAAVKYRLLTHSLELISGINNAAPIAIAGAVDGATALADIWNENVRGFETAYATDNLGNIDQGVSQKEVAAMISMPVAALMTYKVYAPRLNRVDLFSKYYLGVENLGKRKNIVGRIFRFGMRFPLLAAAFVGTDAATNWGVDVVMKMELSDAMEVIETLEEERSKALDELGQTGTAFVESIENQTNKAANKVKGSGPAFLQALEKERDRAAKELAR